MGDVDEVVPSARSRAWIGRAAFEAGLIVLGLVARVRSALASIRAELEANLTAIADAITNDMDHNTLVTLGHAYTSLSDYKDERRVFTNDLYTNPTRDLRQNPQAIAGWLNDMSGHAKRAERRLDNASQTLPPP